MSYDDESWHFDLFQLIRKIILHESLEYRPPNPGRDFQAFLNDRVEELLWHRVGERALLKLAYEVQFDGIAQLRGGRFPKFHYCRVFTIGGKRAHEQ